MNISYGFAIRCNSISLINEYDLIAGKRNIGLDIVAKAFSNIIGPADFEIKPFIIYNTEVELGAL
ncbi:hypothetical protein [Paraflavitalea speifideaquila]|uniref:hypothetical protein n=1 Tax=Paraflavitalea speifideaquila TaxID=3076558 RepID=UPI0028E40C21|nr:hypothetical protein [Paraflavitalea speifideiaquila]